MITLNERQTARLRKIGFKLVSFTKKHDRRRKKLAAQAEAKRKAEGEWDGASLWIGS